MEENKIKPHYKTVFLSDLHIGSNACKIKKLNNFLSSFTCDELYLVGDIIDMWAISRGDGVFTQNHVNVIRKFLTKAKNGTKIYYVIGNHDEFLRKYNDMFYSVGNIYFGNEFLYTNNSKKYLVTHGDMYDVVTLYHKWVAHFGDWLYTLLVYCNTVLNSIRGYFGYNYWSLSGYLKTKVKNALEFIFAYEENLVSECIKQGLNGVICGHIHVAANKHINGIHYLNCGDGVESCTAIIEDLEHNLKIINWG